MPFQSSNNTLQNSKASIVLENVCLLTPEGWSSPTSIWIYKGKIQDINNQIDISLVQRIDCKGSYVLPGMIDLHGDAFERDITPRAGTQFPLDLALAANDANLIANGITTFYYSITDGFEPGPRSRDTVRKLLTLIEKLTPQFSCQARIHIRHEKVNTEKHDELLEWIRNGRIHLLSLNDHLPDLDNERKVQRYLAGLKRRVSMTDEEITEFLKRLQAKRKLGEEQLDIIAKIAHEHGIALASHDDESLDDVARSKSLGVAIAEFPMNEETARACQDGGASVLMGAPNLVRGGSHVGAISVNDAIQQNVVDILCSDYHYPSLFRAPFMVAENNHLSFYDAWKLVSENPAIAAGLGKTKGKIESGYDADFILINELNGSPLSIQSTWVNGSMVYSRAPIRQS